nr:hypothetical protein [Tanacetum cinerariifolium]
MYENFSATSTESFDSIFNRLQKIVSSWLSWRNKSDLDTMSIDDLYNNFKIVEQEVKGTASSNSSSQIMAFMSSPSTNSTNEVPTAYEVSTASTQSSTARTKVSTASSQISTHNLSDATVYAFLSNQSNGSQLVHEDLEQIHEDDLKEIDLKWQLALLSMRAKSYETLKKQYDDLRIEFNKFEFNLVTYKRGLASVEEQLVFYKKNEVFFSEQIAVLKRDISYKNSEISVLKRSQILDNSKKSLGYESYHVVPHPPTRLFSPPKLDLSDTGLGEFQQLEFEGYGPKTSKSVSEDISNEVKENI